MKNLTLDRIRKMKTYAPPLSGRRSYEGTLLDFNERTQPPSKSIVRALELFLKDQQLQVYPEYFDLQKKIAEYAGVDPSWIMLTNGSDQGIDIIFRTFTETGDTVIIPSPSFAMFDQCAQLAGNNIIRPLYEADDLAFPVQDVLRLLAETPKLLVLCNPNNPTGTCLAVQEVERMLKNARNTMVYVDEAYYEFSGISALKLLKKYPNLIVTRTFSKAFGLASLRLGYVIARPEYIEEMIKVRGPYDVNMAAYYAAYAALQDMKGMRKYVSEVMKKGKVLVENFFRKNDIPFFPSAANFILFRPENAAFVANMLNRAGIQVRPQQKQNIEGTLRVTLGTRQQMKRFIQVYEKNIIRTKKRKIALLDRDGTLLFEPQDTFQIDSLEKFKILDGVVEGLRLLVQKGYDLWMITNQDGLGTNSFPLKNFEGPQKKMLRIFRKAGIRFNQILICPHLPSDACLCRKPQTGLAQRDLEVLNLDRKFSFVCGDRTSDRGLAQNLGLSFVPMPTNGNFLKAIQTFLTKKI